MVAAEALVVFVTSLQGYFSFYVLDLFPNSQELAPTFGIPRAGNYAVIYFPDDNHLALYQYYLRKGLPLSLALPSSLLTASTMSSRPWVMETSEPIYLSMRVFHTTLVAAVWLTAMTVQARCLGILARLWDWQQPRSSTSTSPIPLEEFAPGPRPSPPVDNLGWNASPDEFEPELESGELAAVGVA